MSEPRRLPVAVVADDDPVLRLLARRSLVAMGFEVEEAVDGPAALEVVARSSPQIVLLDVDMPGMDGFDTCAALRERHPEREMTVLIATGLTDPESIERAFRVGATDFISKPLDWQLLQHRVRFLMRAHDAFAELRSTLSSLRDSEKRLEHAQRLARVGNWEWTPGERDMLWSDEMYRIFGLEQRAGISTYDAFMQVVHPDDRLVVEKAMRRALHESKGWSLDHRITRGSGEERVVTQQAVVVGGASGAPELIQGTVQDVTERHRAEEQIRYLAYYDSLTSLPNRRMLREHLARALEHAAQRDEVLALVFIDLDRFKRVNDTLGHETGDDLLKAVSLRLMKCVRTTDYVGRTEGPESATVSRLGGDEFTVVLKGVRSSEDVAVVARRILAAMREPFSFRGQELVMSASIGIALYPGDGRDADAILKSADAAMHHAKNLGRDSYQFASESLNRQAMRGLQLESALRSALEHGELALHYQPQRDARTGSIVGVEALMRWNSREFGAVAPSEFIPLAEETRLIEELGTWALHTACAQARAWQQAGLPRLRVAVNVSSHQLTKPGLVENVESALKAARLDPGRLELEITESAMLRDEPGVVEMLARLRSMGVRVALDDFGTGYSSLSHVVRFPIDVLKIDRSFVSDIGSQGQGRAIVAAVLAMAHRLQLDVVAEGVETAEEEQFLRREGCDILQGYHIGRPVDPDALAALLREGS